MHGLPHGAKARAATSGHELRRWSNIRRAVGTTGIGPYPSGCHHRIPYDTEAMLASTMRAGYAKRRALSQTMPWESYRGLNDPDLAAIFSYLRTIPPVHHRVDNTGDPTECRLREARQGGGAEN
jgi:hypothetical protein